MDATNQPAKQPISRRQVTMAPSQADLVQTACEIITAAAALAIGRRRYFRIALAGGSTPRSVYAALAADPYIDWRYWQIFWSDERCAPPTSPDSNYRMAKEALLDRLTTPPPFVMRMAGEGDPDAAAADYERAVRELTPPNPRSGAGDLPRFDLVLLGMGADGHTASLFPHTPALEERTRLVVSNPGPPPHTRRLTFTFPLINAARRTLVLVSGAEKAATLQAVLEGPQDVQQLPSQGLAPMDGALIWLVDQAAGALLSTATIT